ncbi:MAG: hypothetical protein KKE20_04790 [Nanoarchaeota archaeon]|nr:hypothetical protein [Nanoarchaeota archaeon]
MMTQEGMAVKFCKPTAAYECEILGYLQADPDTQTGKTNEFIICKKTDKNKGTWEIDIRSNNLTGTSMTTDKFKEKAANASGEFFTWGSPFNPSAGDARRTEYRFYHESGDPNKIEIYTVGRDSEGNALEPKTLVVGWLN